MSSPFPVHEPFEYLSDEEPDWWQQMARPAFEPAAPLAPTADPDRAPLDPPEHPGPPDPESRDPESPPRDEPPGDDWPHNPPAVEARGAIDDDEEEFEDEDKPRGDPWLDGAVVV